MLVTKDVINIIEFEKKDINLLYSIYNDTDENASEFKVVAYKSIKEASTQQIVNKLIIRVSEYSEDEPASSSFDVYYTNNVDRNRVPWVSHKIVKGLTRQAFVARIKEIFEDDSIKLWSKRQWDEYVAFSVPDTLLNDE